MEAEMLTTFLATLSPIATLFLCIVIGFVARKAKLLPDNAGKVMAKMENWIFVPALNFITMSRFFTVATVRDHATNLILSCIGVGIAISMALLLARFFAKNDLAERGIYKYALTFGNSGYAGDPIVLALFGDLALSYYKIYCIPISIVIYTWGMTVLVPQGEAKGALWKKLLNAPMVAILLGVITGITGLGAHLPLVLTDTLDKLKACMGPVAMLLCGFTVAAYSVPHMLKQGRVYIASLLRLTVLPAILIAALFGIKTLGNHLFGFEIPNSVLFLTFFATATPLGMNTIVFPEAYGGNPKTGASMALISHTLCVITIPLMYALMTVLLGVPSF
ncbi:MAG: hypothetical protein E7657_06735 [Ruminococcaceae bacterium]|nr:hypothetical protein [Oscillospiraceae bacterium]